MERGELQGSLQFDGNDIRRLDDQGLRWIALHPEYFTFSMKTLRTRYRDVLEVCFGPAVIKNPRGPWLYDIRNYTGIESIPLEPWTWPDDVLIGDEDLPMHGRRPKSSVFSDYP